MYLFILTALGPGYESFKIIDFLFEVMIVDFLLIVIFNNFVCLRLKLFDMQFKLLLYSNMHSNVIFKFYQHLFVSKSLFIKLNLALGIFTDWASETSLRNWHSHRIYRCCWRLIRYQFMPHFFKKPCLVSFFAYLAIWTPNLSFQQFFLVRHLGFPEFLLRVPVIFEHLKLINTHMHENLDGLLDIVNYVESVHTIEFALFDLHSVLIHSLNFFLRSYFNIQIKIYNCFSYYFCRWLLQFKITH